MSHSRGGVHSIEMKTAVCDFVEIGPVLRGSRGTEWTRLVRLVWAGKKNLRRGALAESASRGGVVGEYVYISYL